MNKVNNVSLLLGKELNLSDSLKGPQIIFWEQPVDSNTK